jgi:hypothetical protein
LQLISGSDKNWFFKPLRPDEAKYNPLLRIEEELGDLAKYGYKKYKYAKKNRGQLPILFDHLLSIENLVCPITNGFCGSEPQLH